MTGYCDRSLVVARSLSPFRKRGILRSKSRMLAFKKPALFLRGGLFRFPDQPCLQFGIQLVPVNIHQSAFHCVKHYLGHIDAALFDPAIDLNCPQLSEVLIAGDAHCAENVYRCNSKIFQLEKFTVTIDQNCESPKDRPSLVHPAGRTQPALTDADLLKTRLIRRSSCERICLAITRISRKLDIAAGYNTHLFCYCNSFSQEIFRFVTSMPNFSSNSEKNRGTNARNSLFEGLELGREHERC